MRSMKVGLLAVGLLSAGVLAKDANTLIQEFNAALPSGTEARMVWGQLNGARNELWGIDSREGIARKIDVGSVDVMNPQLTYDATRVVFYNQNAGKVQVVNWNGTGLTAGYSAAERIEDYWKDPNSTAEYVVMYASSNYRKLNIATGATSALCSGGDDGARLSPDGTRMAVYNSNDRPGVVAVPGCNSVSSESCTDCGCVINIAPDNTYRFMRQVSGHLQVKITGSGTITGNVTIVASTAGGILAVNTAKNTCTSNSPQFEQTRWVHPEMITFYMDNLNANPYLFNMTSKKWVSIQDNIGCFSNGQSVDAIVSASLPGLVGIEQGLTSQRNAPLAQDVQNSRTYSINGRLLSKARGIQGEAQLKGVVINQSTNGVVTKLCK